MSENGEKYPSGLPQAQDGDDSQPKDIPFHVREEEWKQNIFSF